MGFAVVTSTLIICFCFLVAVSVLRRSKPPVKHVHVWDVWEKAQVNIVNDNGQKLYVQDTQERRCLACGYLERERISSS